MGRIDSSTLKSDDIRELIVELQQCPVHEIKSTVTGFVDELLDKTLQIGQERLKLYDQVAPYIDNTQSSPTILGAFEDIQESYKLQSELLGIYEEIRPPVSSISESTDSTTITNNIQERIVGIEKNIDVLRDNLSFLPQNQESFGWKSSVLVFYSLLLWILGIITSIAIAEFLATSSWALESGISPAFAKIVF